MTDPGSGEVGAMLILLIFILFVKFGLAFAATAGVIILLSLIVWAKHKTGYWKRRGIPGPEPNLIFGNLLQMRKGFKEFDIENAKKYGPISGSVFLGYYDLAISDLDMLKQVLVKDFGSFQNRVVEDVFFSRNSIRKHMLSVLKDQHWKDVRNTITPSLTTGRIKKMFPIMSQCIHVAESIIDDSIQNSNGIIDAKKIFGNLAIDVIAQTAFGIELNTQKVQDSNFVFYARKVFAMSFVGPLVFFLAHFPNVVRFIESTFNVQFVGGDCDPFFEDLLRKIIEQRRKNPRQVNPDFLQILLNATEGSPSIAENDEELMHDVIVNAKKVTLSEAELIAQGFTFLVAGYETTASTLQFAVYSLAANPHVQQTVFEEIKAVLGQKEVIEYEDIAKMTYLEQVMNETLRMYSPISRFNRKCESDVTVNGIKIEKNVFVSVPTFAIHYDERYYPEPEKFDPERFSSIEKAKRNPLTFVPFGFGPRNCVGMRFAQIEIRLTLAYALRKFEFGIPEEFKNRKLELDTTTLTTKPKIPIMLTVKRRNA